MGFGGNGGGSGSIAGSSDVALNSPQDSQVLGYDSSTAKWTNQTVTASSATPGEVALDSFAGATDDDKLAAAISYCSGLTYTPIIRMSNRLYTFTRSIGLPYHGFSLVGSGRGQIGGISTSHPAYHTTVHLEIPPSSGEPAGYWIDCSTGVWWDGYVGGINFYSNSGTSQFIRGAYPGGGIRECTFENLTFQKLYAVLGNDSEALACTICNFTGGWQILDTVTTAVNLGGSDNRSVFGQGIDFYNDGSQWGNAGEKWMCMFNSLARSTVGPMYITASGGWRGLKITGNQNALGLIIDGAIIEGNGPNSPVDGSLIRVEGGVVTFRDCATGYGMANPSITASANSTSVADRGVMEILGPDTQVVIDGMAFYLANTANTTPMVYVSGSPIVRIQNVTHGTGGGTTWGSQLPVVHQTATGLIKDNDTSIQII